MSKILEIRKIEIECIMVCDCGTVYFWTEGNINKCPKCGTETEIVLAPRKVNDKHTNDFFVNNKGNYI